MDHHPESSSAVAQGFATCFAAAVCCNVSRLRDTPISCQTDRLWPTSKRPREPPRPSLPKDCSAALSSCFSGRALQNLCVTSPCIAVNRKVNNLVVCHGSFVRVRSQLFGSMTELHDAPPSIRRHPLGRFELGPGNHFLSSLREFSDQAG